MREPRPAQPADEEGRVVHEKLTPAARSTKLRAAATATAKGTMKAATASAVRQPRSFTIIRKLATQGMNRVMATVATSTCTPSSRPSAARR